MPNDNMLDNDTKILLSSTMLMVNGLVLIVNVTIINAAAAAAAIHTQSYLENGAGIVRSWQHHRAPSSEQAGPSALDRAVEIHTLCRPFVHQQLLLHEARKLRLLSNRGKQTSPRQPTRCPPDKTIRDGT